MPSVRRMPAWMLGFLAPVAGVSAAEPSPALVAAAREEMTAPLAAAAPDSLRYEGPAGRFQLDVGEMDGTAPAEGVLQFRPAGKPLQVVFLGEVGGKVVRKSVKLPLRTSEDAVATFVPFMEGKALARLQGGPAGAVLLAWDGRDLDVLWSSGKPTPGEDRWFELEDVDGDRILEVVAYHQRALETVVEDDLEQGSSGASAAEEAAPVSVLRWDGSRWEKSDKLLEGLR